MLQCLLHIGRLIVEEEQNGNDRAEYGKALLKELSKELTKTYGRGFSLVNLTFMRRFYLCYSISNFNQNQVEKKSQTLSSKFDDKKIFQTVSK